LYSAKGPTRLLIIVYAPSETILLSSLHCSHAAWVLTVVNTLRQWRKTDVPYPILGQQTNRMIYSTIITAL